MNKAVPRAGRVEEITSTANPRIKSIKGLALKKNRQNEGLFIAEGMKLVADALEAGWTVRTLLHSRDALSDERLVPVLERLAAKVRARGGDILVTNEKILTSITRRDNPQMVVAVVEHTISTLNDVTSNPQDVWVALDRVRDPGNLGTIVRTADALGARGVILVGETTDPFALEAVRATMGSLFHTRLVEASEAQFIDFCESWKATGGQVVGSHLKGATDHRLIDYSTGPQIVLMGNEQQGLTDALAEVCSDLALIAMDGAADSLNLAVATGIMLFEARRHTLKGPASADRERRS